MIIFLVQNHHIINDIKYNRKRTTCFFTKLKLYTNAPTIKVQTSGIVGIVAVMEGVTRQDVRK
jgi:hypothetical protein